jgi:hypothetical protein
MKNDFNRANIPPNLPGWNKVNNLNIPWDNKNLWQKALDNILSKTWKIIISSINTNFYDLELVKKQINKIKLENKPYAIYREIYVWRHWDIVWWNNDTLKLPRTGLSQKEYFSNDPEQPIDNSTIVYHINQLKRELWNDIESFKEKVKFYFPFNDRVIETVKIICEQLGIQWAPSAQDVILWFKESMKDINFQNSYTKEQIKYLLYLHNSDERKFNLNQHQISQLKNNIWCKLTDDQIKSILFEIQEFPFTQEQCKLVGEKLWLDSNRFEINDFAKSRLKWNEESNKDRKLTGQYLKNYWMESESDSEYFAKLMISHAMLQDKDEYSFLVGSRNLIKTLKTYKPYSEKILKEKKIQEPLYINKDWKRWWVDEEWLNKNPDIFFFEFDDYDYFLNKYSAKTEKEKIIEYNEESFLSWIIPFLQAENSKTNNIMLVNLYLDKYQEYIKTLVQELDVNNINKLLNHKKDLISDYGLKFILNNYKKNQNLDNILIDFIWNKIKEIQNDSKKLNNFFNEFLKIKDKNNLWKYVLYKLKSQDNNISNVLWDINQNEEIRNELKIIDYRNNNLNIKIDTLLWDNIPLREFYVPQNLTKESKNLSSDDLVKEILTSDKKIFAIQAAGWSWKTILSKYLLMNLSDSSLLHKNNASSARVKEIDLNDYTSETIQDFLQWPENIIVIDALDEKNPDTVKKLAEISNSDEFQNSGKKLIILGRYIDKNFLYKDEDEKTKKDSSEIYQLQEEVSIKEYIQSFTKTIKPELQEKFEKELYDIVGKLNNELHTPIIIEMLANIIKRKLTSWRNKKIFLDEQGNEKTDITRKDIYDIFFEYLHQREDNKSDDLWQNSERLYQNNPFMWEKYDELRKEFLMYLTMIETLGTQKSCSTPQRNEWWSIELWEETFQDVFRDFMLYKSDNKQAKMINDFVIDEKEGKTFEKHLHNIELFKETLLSTNILKKNQNGKLSFHHKTFEEYFGYLFYENNNPEILFELIQNDIKKIKDIKHLNDIDFKENIKNIINYSQFSWEENMHNIIEKYIQMYEAVKDDETLSFYWPRFFENIERCLIKFWNTHWWLTLDYSNILPYLAEYWDEILYEHIGVFGTLPKETIKKIFNTTLSLHDSPEAINNWMGWIVPKNINRFKWIDAFTKEDFEELADNIIKTTGVWDLIHYIKYFTKLDELYHKKIVNFVLHDQHPSDSNDYSDIWYLIKNIKDIQWLDHDDYINIIEKDIKENWWATIFSKIYKFPIDVIKKMIIPLTHLSFEKGREGQLLLGLWKIKWLNENHYQEIARIFYHNGRAYSICVAIFKESKKYRKWLYLDFMHDMKKYSINSFEELFDDEYRKGQYYWSEWLKYGDIYFDKEYVKSWIVKGPGVWLKKQKDKLTWLNNKYIIDELMKTKSWLSALVANKDILKWLKKQDCQEIFDSLIKKWPEYYYYLYSLRDDVIWKIWLNNDILKKLMETDIWCSVLSWNINTLKDIDPQDYRYIVKKTIESGTWYWIWGIVINIDTLDFLDKDDHKNIADKLLKWTRWDVKILLNHLPKMNIDQNIYTKKAYERFEVIRKEKAKQDSTIFHTT